MDENQFKPALVCPQCGNRISDPKTLRCPRCNKAIPLHVECKGCGKCSSKK